MSKDGPFYILDVRDAQLGPGANENMIRQTAAPDGITVPVRIK